MTAHREPSDGTIGSLRFTADGDVGILELARPEKRNALNPELIRGLQRFFSAPPPGVKAVVLCGAGDHFSAGLDLASLSTMTNAEHVISSMGWHRAFEAIEFGAVPVVAVLHGGVIGGGLELAAAAHIRVAAESAYYALPEGQRGIYLGGGGSVRLPRLIGTSRVMDMMLTGRTYSANEGQILGISQYLVSQDDARNKGLDIARAIARNAPLSNFAVIQALPRTTEASLHVGYFTEALMATIAQDDEEARSRVNDFLEKRARKVTPP